MNQIEKAREVGNINAVTAIDQRNDPFYADSRVAYRQNVIDTMDELGLIDHRDVALAAYDEHIAAHWPKVKRNSATFTGYQTVYDADGDQIDADRWTNDTLHDAVAALHRTRTAHVDGVQYQIARYIPHSATAIFTVCNGPEFRTGCKEQRELAIIGITRCSARRLSRLLCCEWQA